MSSFQINGLARSKLEDPAGDRVQAAATSTWQFAYLAEVY